MEILLMTRSANKTTEVRPATTRSSMIYLALKRATIVIFAANLLAIVGFAQSCQTSASIPADKKKLGGSTATAHYDGITTVKGGQGVYVKIKNLNVLGVSYILSIAEDVKPELHICTYKALLPPQSSVILYGALFAETPIGWKISLSIGPESSAGVLSYDVYSMAETKKKR